MKHLPLDFRKLDLNVICDICGKGRPTGRHRKCSQIRQARRRQESSGNA